MRVLWTLLKVIVGLAVAIPVGIFVLSLTVGVVGALLGLAIMALRLACIGFVGYGLYRLGRHLFGASPKPVVSQRASLPPVDPYYQAAMRELDTELGGNR